MTLHLDGPGELDDALRAVAENDAEVFIERDGKTIAILVSPRYLNAFRMLSEELENRLDAHAYREAKEAFIESGESTISYDDLRKSLGL